MGKGSAILKRVSNSCLETARICAGWSNSGTGTEAIIDGQICDALRLLSDGILKAVQEMEDSGE